MNGPLSDEATHGRSVHLFAGLLQGGCALGVEGRQRIRGDQRESGARRLGDTACRFRLVLAASARRLLGLRGHHVLRWESTGPLRLPPYVQGLIIRMVMPPRSVRRGHETLSLPWLAADRCRRCRQRCRHRHRRMHW
ncbi:hypothetical protein [Streptomyces sp. GC420]|uniref:hypothetical protein n=1 Tax=Streptomyces sp. GC420 TaxID=2697568 RepID=UPI0014150EFF|nr:hypothetical protein [Streptomyces sp. GC420]NBM15129.1 hypothetical protein [Streptomyces sp. GC420]